MSLKAFHIVFISVSTVLSGVFALWCFREMSRTQSVAAAAGGAIGVLALIGLLVYGVAFLRRARGIGYL